MSLAEFYDSADINVDPHPNCRTCRWYRALSQQDREFFDQTAAREVNYARLWRACQKAGLDVADGSFRNHINHHMRRTS